ncbi:MAG: polysaccharide deacetylase family protein [Gammaproteobacteria bacterium]|nr:polysaccharide deacetylase family protein [Gammaproteobacteria bacterium]
MLHSVQPDNILTATAKFSIDPWCFERKLRFLTKYNVISMTELVYALENHRQIKDVIVLTFDDGYEDNYTIAYPILKKYSLPAIIYLTANYIGTEKWLPLNRFYYAILNTPLLRINESLLNKYLFTPPSVDISTQEKRMAFIREMRPRLKILNIATLQKFIEELSASLGITTIPDTTFAMLKWHQIRSMTDSIEFGSHTMNHSILATCDATTQHDEIFNSKQCIEDNLKLTVNHFAYPNGHKSDYTPETIRLLKQAGYQSAVSTEHGIAFDTENLFELRRMSLDLPNYRLSFELLGVTAWIRKLLKK